MRWCGRMLLDLNRSQGIVMRNLTGTRVMFCWRGIWHLTGVACGHGRWYGTWSGVDDMELRWRGCHMENFVRLTRLAFTGLPVRCRPYPTRFVWSTSLSPLDYLFPWWHRSGNFWLVTRRARLFFYWSLARHLHVPMRHLKKKTNGFRRSTYEVFFGWFLLHYFSDLMSYIMVVLDYIIHVLMINRNF